MMVYCVGFKGEESRWVIIKGVVGIGKIEEIINKILGTGGKG